MTRLSRRLGPLGFLLLLLPAGAAGEISAETALRAPRPDQIATLLDQAREVGYDELEVAAREAAFQAAEAKRFAAMESWLLLTRWARLLRESEATVTQRWVLAINTAALGHANMPRTFALEKRPLAARLKPSTLNRLVGKVEFSRAFFEQLSPYDNLPAVLTILDEIVTAAPEKFDTYHQLALAIALVHDVPPPPDWPHRQVGPSVLPRRLPAPVETFLFWTELDRQRLTLHRLSQLPAVELKHVVNAIAPPAEQRWAHREARYTLATLPQAYDAIRYRKDRLETNTPHWPGNDYQLSHIRREGGICVDQAYFATEVGKAWGVPTLLFYGAGKDGRHAWFGFLDAGQRWRMDVGRYAAQQYIVGTAMDPQTWADVTDHELAFLAERFRLLPSYQQSRLQLLRAEELLRLERYPEAVEAARSATNFERRHAEAWDVLLEAMEAAQVEPVQLESAQRDAARAFLRYPDLHVRYLRAVVGTLRARGQVSAAENEERLIAEKYTHDRGDLAAAQAASILLRSLAEDPPEHHLRTFERCLFRFNGSAGMFAFDRLVRPFVKHLKETERWPDARRAVQIARRTLSVQPGTQFDREVTALETELARAGR